MKQRTLEEKMVIAEIQKKQPVCKMDLFKTSNPGIVTDGKGNFFNIYKFGEKK